MKPIIEGPENSSESRLATLVAAAGDPIRLRILNLLRHGSRSVGEICELLQAAQPRVSHHLSILRRSGLLEVEVKGRQRFYRWPIDTPNTPDGDLRSFLRRWLTHAEGHEDKTEAPTPSTVQPPAVRNNELEDFLL